MEYAPLERERVDGVVELSTGLGWPSYSRDAATTWRALSAPGSTTWVALDANRVVGLAHILSDGVVQSHLALLGVAEGHRRRGIARELLRRAFRESGGQWLDLVSDPGAEDFYRSLFHDERVGFRVYPDR